MPTDSPDGNLQAGPAAIRSGRDRAASSLQTISTQRAVSPLSMTVAG
jgi:hypothetical protein